MINKLKNTLFKDWKTTAIFILLLITIGFFAYRIISNSISGFKVTESGLKYRFITKLKGKTPIQGDIILMKYAMISSKGDTLVNHFKNDTFMEINVYTNKPNNELMEGMFMMGAGDVAEFKILSDSLKKKIRNETTDFLPLKSEVSFIVRVEQVLNYDQYVIYRTRKRLKIYEIEDRAIDKYAEDLKKNWILDSFERVKYFIENKTNNPRFKDGDIIEFHAKVSLLNGQLDIDSKMEGRKLRVELGKDNYRISGLHRVMYYLANNESGIFLVPSSWGYGAAGKIGIPSYAPLAIEIYEPKKIN